VPELLYYPATWLDRDFKKTWRKLPAREQQRFEEELGDLLEALGHCSHPMTDPVLGRWRPTAYRLRKARFQAAEYRLRGLTRVIVGFLPDPQGCIGAIVLLTVTLKHDHPRILRVLGQHRGEILETLEP
jgi:mRNA-degrading endonuclease RelE of RelBE toxin-antitoxin system